MEREFHAHLRSLHISRDGDEEPGIFEGGIE
jgi:hypothetical protein